MNIFKRTSHEQPFVDPATHTPYNIDTLMERRAKKRTKEMRRARITRRVSGGLALFASGVAAGYGIHAGLDWLDSHGNNSNKAYHVSSDTGHKHISSVAFNGANIRYDPIVMDSDSEGGNNLCATTHPRTRLVLKPPIDALVDNRPHSPDGPWLGLPLARMPSKIQDKCAGDADGIVWVSFPRVNSKG